jgi:transcriptional regulator with GAF, ATPase, and Fis domain
MTTESRWVSVGLDAACLKPILRDLGTRGVVLKPCSNADHHGSTLVFFSEAAEASDRIRTLVDSSARRILAVRAGPHAEVSFRDCTRILDAGAGEVLSWAEAGADGVSALLRRWSEIDATIDSDLVRSNLVGASPTWRRFLRELVEAARFSDAPILVSGQTGTGKELAARLVHAVDGRTTKGDLVDCDCTTIVPELVGSELFGHVRGAFTGSTGPRDGALALADGGTLFLDEIGELPLELQGHLLRAVQERTFKPVGGNDWKRSSFRLVCATNRDLAAEVDRGRFRRDLYYRLAGAVCVSPPLSERRDDIVTLAGHFLCEFLGTHQPPALSAALRAYLLARDYPGNVRDLRRLVQSIARKHLGVGPVSLGCVPEYERGDLHPLSQRWTGTTLEQWVGSALEAGVGLKEIGRTAEEAAIRLALARHGTMRAAAEGLGVTQRALQLRQAQQRGERAHAGILVSEFSVSEGVAGRLGEVVA